jgi:predicted  nucleic acid-binding Zn-ribbon protein
VAQAVKDTLPYFLGAVDDEQFRKQEELRRLKAELRAYQRNLSEMKAISGEGASKAQALLAQARDSGLTTTVSTTGEEVISALDTIDKTPTATIEADLPTGEEYARLTAERDALIEEQRRLDDEIAGARAFQRDETGFSDEASRQAGRLVSIGIFDAIGSHSANGCPLCGQDLEGDASVPNVEDVQATLHDVSSRLEAVGRAAPQVEKAIADLESKLEGVRSALADNRAAMDAVRRASDRLQELRDEAAKKTLIIGRISLYLENLPDLPDTQALEAQIADLRKQCAELEDELSSERVRERVDSISSILGRWMSDSAAKLKLEHSDFPLRLDFQKLTTVTDKPDGPIPMDRMGSGENWVGHHLIAHLGLHKLFTEQRRPVPRFLFLDQLSQVYFPTGDDKDGSLAALGDDDLQALSRMFGLVFEVVKQLTPGFQVVLTEHADLSEDWYEDAVVERWRGVSKLVPEHWPVRDSGDAPAVE